MWCDKLGRQSSSNCETPGGQAVSQGLATGLLCPSCHAGEKTVMPWRLHLLLKRRKSTPYCRRMSEYPACCRWKGCCSQHTGLLVCFLRLHEFCACITDVLSFGRPCWRNTHPPCACQFAAVSGCRESLLHLPLAFLIRSELCRNDGRDQEV